MCSRVSSPCAALALQTESEGNSGFLGFRDATYADAMFNLFPFEYVNIHVRAIQYTTRTHTHTKFIDK